MYKNAESHSESNEQDFQNSLNNARDAFLNSPFASFFYSKGHELVTYIKGPKPTPELPRVDPEEAEFIKRFDAAMCWDDCGVLGIDRSQDILLIRAEAKKARNKLILAIHPDKFREKENRMKLRRDRKSVV